MTSEEMIRKFNFLVFLFFTLLFGFSSCRTGRELPSGRLPAMSAGKVLDKARQNAFDFENLTIRRINVQFTDRGTSASFRASLKAARDEKILASVSKLNLPVGRVLLTPDSITYVNYIDRNYFTGDYSFLSSLLNFNLSFNVVQAIITNPVKTGINSAELDYRRFTATVENGRYVLQSDYRPSGANPGQRKFFNRNSDTREVYEGEELIVRKLMFNPISFVLEKLTMEDSAEGRMLEVHFSDFVKVDGYDYPGAIDIQMASGNELTELNIKLRGFSTGRVDSLKLDIPRSYLPVR